MDERKIQKDYVMNYLCRREDEGGLGYRYVAPNVVQNGMFIPSVLAEFISDTQPAEWSRLMRKFGNDERALQNELVEAIREKVIDKQNVAIFFNTFKTITFNGEQLTLFYVPGTELRGDEDFKKNIFCAVEEAPHKQKYNGNMVTNIRPDVTFYLNGIFLGYMELKCVSMGQNAKEQGRGKVAKDYLSAVHAIVEAEKTDSQVTKKKKQLLAIYEKAIHITASDINETYVMRNMAQMYDLAHGEFTTNRSTATIDRLVPDVCKVFKAYPVSSPLLTEKQKFEEVARALYSKNAIKNEILYYNFIEYNYEKKKDGKRVRKSNSGRLISPRPKQKFGCDKIIGRIKEMLDNEGNPDYYTDKLRSELYALGIPQQKTEEIIAKRERFCNNKFVYSLLMQYAAGFGKSNIIGWTALQLKDYRYQDAYAYDKIMLVVDRLQLRDQLDERMYNMNIDKSMFVEATDKETFVKALDDQRRIIVVNIQKFLDLQQAIDDAGKKLKNMRVAFLIDEIHRSNSGENNKEMINLFERLQDSFNHGGQKIYKKNLLIGFTATPSDETLSRFGEFRSATTVPLWVPFDTYSMKEAIDDDYILDPTKHIIPYNVPVGFEMPKDIDLSDEDNIPDVRQKKQKVYEFEPRMRKIAAFVVDRLVSLVYGKIRGEGKAMLAVTSIPIAIKYTRIIRELYAKKCAEPRYAKYAKAPIVVVYSDSQKYESCASVNGDISEAQAIDNFKNGKNGLIIVVDKLQTGFDEPKLHTLFLDKEIKDINAIQTISRVNRTCKYKTECHVIDCSWRNVNTKNINLAFKKYCDMVISQFNPEEEAKLIAGYYKDMTASKPYIQWFNEYVQKKDDADFILDMESSIRDWVNICMAREAAIRKQNEELGLEPGDADYVQPENEAKMLRYIVGQYASALMSLKNVYDIATKYTEETFLDFWQVFCKIYRDATKKTGDDIRSYDVVDSDEIAGITDVDDGDDEPGNGGKKRKKGPKEQKPKEVSLEKILELLKHLNEQELISAREAQRWLAEIGVMFESLRQKDKLCVVLRDDKTQDEEKLREYRKFQNIYKLVDLKKRPDLAKVDKFKKMLDDNVEQFYSIFMEQLKDVDNGDSDFDYDTTSGSEPTSSDSMSMDDLMEIVRKKMHPDYNEDALKECLCRTYAPHFEKIAGKIRPMEKTVDNLFRVLNTESLDTLDGVDSIVKESLNMLCIAEGLPANEKRMHLNQLLMKYEAFLKKLYYLINHKELEGKEPGKDATLSSAIFDIPSLKKLKYSEDPEVKAFSDRLDILRQLRNDEAHGSYIATEQEVDAAIGIVIDMYLYVAGTNTIPVAKRYDKSIKYQDYDEDRLQMVAEDIVIPGSIEVRLRRIKKEELLNGHLDLVLMYAIGPMARKKTESAGRIALGIKEYNLSQEVVKAFVSVRYIMFHYWKNSEATPFELTAPTRLVSKQDIPEGFLIRQEKDARQYLLIEYNPDEPAELGECDILKAQRKGSDRYIPFVCKIGNIKVGNND